MALTHQDREILEFEGSWWTRVTTKQRGIRLEMSMAPSTYYRRLAALVDLTDAYEHSPLVVRRLRRRRAERLRERFCGPSAHDRRS